jgi:HK97 gp10 family phage protein
MAVFFKSRLPQISLEIRVRLDDLVDETAEAIASAAKDRVPVDSGKLRNAIHTEERPDGAHVVAGNEEAFYGHIIEHGSVKTPPRPFLVPALESERTQAEAKGQAILRGL